MSVFLKKEMYFDVKPLNKDEEFVYSNKHLYRKAAKDSQKTVDYLTHGSLKWLLFLLFLLI